MIYNFILRHLNLKLWSEKILLLIYPILGLLSVILAISCFLFPPFLACYSYIFIDLSLFTIIICSLGIHLFLLPLQFILNKHNAWDIDVNNSNYITWLHPRILKHLSLAIVYPYVFGLYYSLVRYHRLGNTIFVDYFIMLDYQYLVLITFLVGPNVLIIFSPFLEKVFTYFIMLKNLLWNQTFSLFYSWYIYLLSFNFFFLTLDILYRTIYKTDYYLNINNATYWCSNEKLPWYRHFISYLYNDILIVFYFCILGFVSLELIITKGYLYYSFYLLFFTPIIRLTGFFLRTFRFSNFNCDVSLSDYLYKNWENVRFPRSFPSFVQSADIFFPFNVTLNAAEKLKLDKMMSSSLPKENFRKKTSFALHTLELTERVKNYPWSIRIAAEFYDRKHRRLYHYSSCIQKRFFHSSNIVYYPNNNNSLKMVTKEISVPKQPLHPATATICRSPMQKVSMLNKDYLTYDPINKTEKRFGGFPLHPNTFVNGIEPPKPNEKSFVTHTEVGNRTYFHHSETAFGIKPSRFYSHCPVSYDSGQKRPDTILDCRSSNVSDNTRVHPYDAKLGQITRYNNLVVSNRNSLQYGDILENHKTILENSKLIKPAMLPVFAGLRRNHGNVSGQQDVLMPNLHLFPNAQLPSLHNPENFYTGWFSKLAQSAYAKAHDTVLTVNDFLIINNIPRPQNKEEWEVFYTKTYPLLKRDLDNKFGNSNWSIYDDYL